MAARPAKGVAALFLFFLLSLLFSSSFVYASASINLPPQSERTVIFQPGLEKSFTWTISGARELSASLTGELTDYFTLEDPSPGGGPRAVTMHMRLPDTLPPKTYRTYLRVVEGKNGGMVGARAAVEAPIYVIVLSDEPLAVANLDVKNAEAGQRTSGTLTLTSRSKVTTKGVYADITVEDDEHPVHITTPPVDLASREERSIPFILPTQDLKPGRYTAVAMLNNAGESSTAKAFFRLGTLELLLLRYPRHLSTGAINRFEFTIESRWNNPLEGVYATVQLGDAEDTTVSTTIPAFDSVKLHAFLDFQNLNESANLTGEITVYYPSPEGGWGAEVFPISVGLLKKRLPTTDLKKETPQTSRAITIPLNTLTLLYLIAVLLVIANIILLLKGSKK